MNDINWKQVDWDAVRGFLSEVREEVRLALNTTPTPDGLRFKGPDYFSMTKLGVKVWFALTDLRRAQVLIPNPNSTPEDSREGIIQIAVRRIGDEELERGGEFICSVMRGIDMRCKMHLSRDRGYIEYELKPHYEDFVTKEA